MTNQTEKTPPKPTDILLITTRENEGILRQIPKKEGYESPRTQIGSNWSLRRFIDKDLKNYMTQTYFALDITAFIEQGDEFVALLEELRAKHEKCVFVIIGGKLIEGDRLLDSLVQKGFTNIIANFSGEKDNEKFELISKDFKECFSENGLSVERYSRFLIKNETSNEDENQSEIPEKPNTHDFSGMEKVICIFGSQSRIGATTFALNLCGNVSAGNGKAALVLVGIDANTELEFMREYFNADCNNDYLSINGIDVFTSDNSEKVCGYNLIVYDFGDIHKNTDCIPFCENSDAVYLCCGIGWKELHHTVSAQNFLTGVKYTTVVLTNDAGFGGF